jgi:hypothetical protein
MVLPYNVAVFIGHNLHVVFDVAEKSSENVLYGHSMHSADPVLFLYVPAGHETHELNTVCLCSSVYPLSHMHSLRVATL